MSASKKTGFWGVVFSTIEVLVAASSTCVALELGCT